MKLEVITQKPETYKSKTPILFVHGMWHSAWCWAEKFMPYFAEMGYETHALSLRGHGKSEGGNKLRWASLSDYVNDVAQVANSLERPPIIIGHSMGGMIVQKYLEEHEAAGVVLLSSATPAGVIASTVRIALKHPIRFLKTNLTLSLYPIVNSVQRCKEMFYSDDIAATDLDRYFSQLQDESFRAFMDMMFFKSPDSQQIKKPVLVLGGENDKALSPEKVKKTAAMFDTEAHIFPGTAHNMMLESNWQRVADKMINWIEEERLL